MAFGIAFGLLLIVIGATNMIRYSRLEAVERENARR